MNLTKIKTGQLTIYYATRSENGSEKNSKVPNPNAGLHVPCPAPAQYPA
jgi:hypothetical protein